MSDAPNCDWDLIHRWDWFRHPRWRPGFRADILGEGGGSCKAFAELCAVIGAESALDMSCGLGRKTICLSEMNVNVLGCDGSEEAIRRARDLARLENRPVTFFQSAWRDLPETAPHRVDAVFNDALASTTTWDALKETLAAVYMILKPGGFFMFFGAPEGDDADAGRRRLDDDWACLPQEEAAWTFRDGGTSCALLLQRQRGDDFLDTRHLYLVEEHNEPRLESTVCRTPYYWSWDHWRELTRDAGFCHLETRRYEGYGRNGETFTLNVAWRSPNGAAPPAPDRHDAPYRE